MKKIIIILLLFSHVGMCVCLLPTRPTRFRPSTCCSFQYVTITPRVSVVFFFLLAYCTPSSYKYSIFQRIYRTWWTVGLGLLYTRYVIVIVCMKNENGKKKSRFEVPVTFYDFRQFVSNFRTSFGEALYNNTIRAKTKHFKCARKLSFEIFTASRRTPNIISIPYNNWI